MILPLIVLSHLPEFTLNKGTHNQKLAVRKISPMERNRSVCFETYFIDIEIIG